MTERPVVASAYPGYATPTFVVRGSRWHVVAEPWHVAAGAVDPNLPAGWTAWDTAARYVGLFPDMQAAGEALVRHAGYEVLQ